MATSDWSSTDLELCSSICERISGYSDRLEPHLQGLLDKFQNLGKKLNDLSGRLQESSTLYHDPHLENHLHSADLELQTQRPTSSEPRAGLTGRIPWLQRNNDNELTMKRIKQLHFEVDAHIDTAEKFRTEFLFNHAYPKLEYIIQKLLQQGQRESGTSHITDTSAIHSNERASYIHNTQSNPSAFLPIGNHDANILAHAPTAVQIARIIWNSGAEALDLDQRRPKPDHFSSADAVVVRKDEHILAKEKFLYDVLSLIEETQLDDRGMSTGGLSRAVLDRLAGIVLQASELKNTLPSPEIGAPNASACPSPRQTRGGDMLQPPVTGPATINGRIPILTPPETRSSSTSPQTVGQSRKIPRKPLPLPSNPISPPISGATAPVDDPARQRGLNGSWQEADLPEPSSSAEFPSIGSPAISSSDLGYPIATGDERERHPPHASAVAIGKQPARIGGAAQDTSNNPSSWIQISSLEAGLKPSFCTLEFTSWKDKQFLLAVLVTEFGSAPSIEGSAQRVSSQVSSTSHMDYSGSSHALSNARTFEHMILPDTRLMPSVMYPDYEGPDYRPDAPYTITFTEQQSLCEYMGKPRPHLVGDLKYIFSDKAERDRVRSSLFGKRLLLPAGVERIDFDYVACLFGAVSLWEEATSKPLTITFNRNSNASRSRPHGEVEYEIITLVIDGNHPKASEPLELRVRQVAGPGFREGASKEKYCRLFFSRSDEKAAFISFANPPKPFPPVPIVHRPDEIQSPRRLGWLPASGLKKPRRNNRIG